MRKLANINTPSPAMKTTKASFSPEATVTQQPQRSPWHSPVPYLFGGLAAMLGLIAFALLILACSYWRLSGRLDSGGDNQSGERDVESGEKDQEGGSAKDVKVYEEKILVIMAGDEKPTFLATPVSSKAYAFGEGKEMIVINEGEKVENGEKAKEIIMADHEVSISTTHHEEDRDRDNNQENQQDQEQNQ